MNDSDFYDISKKIVNKYDRYPYLFDVFKLLNNEDVEEVKRQKKFVKESEKKIKKLLVDEKKSYGAISNTVLDGIDFVKEISSNNIEQYEKLELLTRTLSKIPYKDSLDNYFKYNDYCRKYSAVYELTLDNFLNNHTTNEIDNIKKSTKKQIENLDKEFIDMKVFITKVINNNLNIKKKVKKI